MSSSVFIILPVHNRKRTTRLFLDCLDKQDYKNFTLVLIDDGSTDGTVGLLDKYSFKKVVLHGDGSLFWGGGLEVGYNYILEEYTNKKISNDDIVLICNDDIEFDKYLLESIVADLESIESAIIHAKVLDQKTGESIKSGIHYDFNRMSFKVAENVKMTNCLPTRCLYMYAADYVNVQGYKSRYIRHYLSDYFLTISFWKNGYKLLESSNTVIKLDNNTTKNKKAIFNQKFSKKYLDIRSPRYIKSRFFFAFFISSGLTKLVLPLKILVECIIDYFRMTIKPGK